MAAVAVAVAVAAVAVAAVAVTGAAAGAVGAVVLLGGVGGGGHRKRPNRLAKRKRSRRRAAVHLQARRRVTMRIAGGGRRRRRRRRRRRLLALRIQRAARCKGDDGPGGVGRRARGAGSARQGRRRLTCDVSCARRRPTAPQSQLAIGPLSSPLADPALRRCFGVLIHVLIPVMVIWQLCLFLGTPGLLCFFGPAVFFKCSATHTTHTPMSFVSLCGN